MVLALMKLILLHIRDISKTMSDMDLGRRKDRGTSSQESMSMGRRRRGCISIMAMFMRGSFRMDCSMDRANLLHIKGSMLGSLGMGNNMARGSSSGLMGLLIEGIIIKGLGRGMVNTSIAKILASRKGYGKKEYLMVKENTLSQEEKFINVSGLMVKFLRFLINDFSVVISSFFTLILIFINKLMYIISFIR